MNVARCDVCNVLAIGRAEPWRCPKCRTLHVPGWDDSRASMPQDPDEGSAGAGIAFGFLLVLILGSGVLAVWLVCRGAA